MIGLSKQVPCTSLFSDLWVHHISEPESFFPVEQYKQISSNVHIFTALQYLKKGICKRKIKSAERSGSKLYFWHKDTMLSSLKQESVIYKRSYTHKQSYTQRSKEKGTATQGIDCTNANT